MFYRECKILGIKMTKRRKPEPEISNKPTRFRLLPLKVKFALLINGQNILVFGAVS